MQEEWVNRIALTWANRTRPRQVRTLLERYGTATQVVSQLSETIT